MTKTNAEHQKDFVKRMRDRGYKLLKIWTPDDDSLRDKIKDHAKSLITEYEDSDELPDEEFEFDED